jgi:hypothetical protein
MHCSSIFETRNLDNDDGLWPQGDFWAVSALDRSQGQQLQVSYAVEVVCASIRGLVSYRAVSGHDHAGLERNPSVHSLKRKLSRAHFVVFLAFTSLTVDIGCRAVKAGSIRPLSVAHETSSHEGNELCL